MYASKAKINLQIKIVKYVNLNVNILNTNIMKQISGLETIQRDNLKSNYHIKILTLY